MTELDSFHRKKDPDAEAALKLEISGLQEALNERDRTIGDLKKQMKYYVAFAENSITGHPDEPTKEEVEAQLNQRLVQLQEELDGAKVRRK